MSVYPRQSLNEDIVAQLRFCCLFGDERTSTQDPLFAVDQIIEIAVRALSPGINDPYTALACINKLGEALEFMAEHDEPLKFWLDDNSRLRLIRARNTYAVVLDRAFGQLRQYGVDHPVICLSVMRLMNSLARLDIPIRYRNALRQQAELFIEGIREATLQAADKQQLEQQYEEFRQLTTQQLTG